MTKRFLSALSSIFTAAEVFSPDHFYRADAEPGISDVSVTPRYKIHRTVTRHRKQPLSNATTDITTETTHSPLLSSQIEDDLTLNKEMFQTTDIYNSSVDDFSHCNVHGLPNPLPVDFNVTPHLEMLQWACNCTSHTENNSVPNVENFMCMEHINEHSWWVTCIYYIMFGIIVLLAVGGNLTVVWIVLAHKRMRTVTNYFLVNLAISDVSISIFNVCFSFIFNFYYTWWFGEIYCIFSNFMGVVPTCASVFTLMSMSLDRYVAIIYPLRRRLSQKKTISIIVGIWVAAAVCGLPMLLYSHTDAIYYFDGSQQIICKSDRYPDGNVENSVLFEIYNNFLLIVNYLLPLVVLFATYLRIGMELWGSPTIGEHRHEENMRAKRKVVKMMLAVVAIFMICWLPYHVYFTLLMKKFALMNFYLAQHLYLNMYWLAMSSTIINPIIYCWMNSKFRVGFRYIYGRCLPFKSIRLSNEEYRRSELMRSNRSVPTCHSDFSWYSRVPSSSGRAGRSRATSRMSQTSTHTSNGLGPHYRGSTSTSAHTNGRFSRESDFASASDFSPPTSHVVSGSPTNFTASEMFQNGKLTPPLYPPGSPSSFC